MMRLVLNQQEMVDAIAYYLKHVKSMEATSVCIGQDTNAWGYKIIATVDVKDVDVSAKS
jgi:hypothetical protein